MCYSLTATGGPLRRLLGIVFLGSLTIAIPASAQDGNTLRTALSRLWAAETGDEVARSIGAILALEASVDQLVALLRTDQMRSAIPAETGVVSGVRAGAGGRSFPYRIHAPASYDSTRAYPLYVFLHGGVSRGPWQPGEDWMGWADRIAHSDRILLLPAAWNSAPWWSLAQVENINALIRTVASTYNVDRSRVYLTGVSDGGTGVWFFAMRDPSRFASFSAFIAHPSVLLNPEVGAQGPFFLDNARARPVHVVSTDQDQLYPIESVNAVLSRFRGVGADITSRIEPGTHDISWWPSIGREVQDFYDRTAREAHPDSILWVASDPTYGRLDWLVIDDIDELAEPLERTLSRSAVPAGRVSAVRDGNEIRLTTLGVRKLRLLLSSESLDLNEPLRVFLNGEVVFDEKVKQDPVALLQWAWFDRDPSRLYTAQIELSIPRSSRQ